MKPLSLLLSFSLISSSFAALAEVQTYKDWTLQAGLDEVFQKEACTTGTSVSTGSNRAQLDLSFTKDQQNVPQLQLKVWDQVQAEEVLYIRVSSKISYPLFLWKKSAQADQPNVYWYAPIGWAPLMDYIAGANSLKIIGSSGLELALSLKGSSVSLDRTEKCVAAKSLLPEDFLKKLNAKTESAATLLPSIDEMISNNEKAFSIYRQGLAQTKELNDLRKDSSKLLKQEASLLEEAAATERRLTRSQEALDSELANKEKLQSDLSKAQSDKVQLEQQLILAQQVAAQKKAVYEPKRDQLAPYVSEVLKKIDAVERNEKSERSLKNEVNSLENQISSIRSEKQNLSQRISNLEYNKSDAQRDYERDRDEASRYDVHRRIREDINRAGLDRDRHEVRNLEEKARDYDRRRDNLKAEADYTRTQISECKKQENANCDKEETRLRDIQQKHREAKLGSEQAKSRANQLRNNIQYTESRIRQEHESEKSRLERRADQSYSRYRSVESDLDQARSRYGYLDRELPGVESQLSSAKRKLSSVRSEKSALVSALDGARHKRDEFKRQIGFDLAESEYQAAAQAVKDIENGISTAKSTIVKSETGLKKSGAQLVELEKDLTKRKSNHQKSLANLAPVQEQLKPMREKEALLAQALEALAKDFDSGKAQYQRTYESWIQEPAAQMMQIEFEQIIGTF